MMDELSEPFLKNWQSFDEDLEDFLNSATDGVGSERHYEIGDLRSLLLD